MPQPSANDAPQPDGGFDGPVGGDPAFLAACSGLSDRERLRLSRFRHPGRRAEFVASRRLAKALLRSSGQVKPQTPDEAISILPKGTGSQRPRVWVGHQRREIDLSLSHMGADAGGPGWVAVAISAGPRIGIDLVRPNAAASERLAVWFTDDERRLANDESLTLVDLWAMKEAAFKATSEQQPFRPADFPIAADKG